MIMQFRILGPVEAGTDSGEPIAVGGPRVKTLLAALVVHANQTLRIDWLSDAIWDGQPPPTAAATLHSYVCRLRSRLAGTGPDGADRIRTDADGYRLRVEPGELDSDVFQDLMDRGRSAAGQGRHVEACEQLKSALKSWRGPALANISAKFAEVFAVSLDESRVAVMAEWLELELGLGRHQEVIPDLRMLTQRYPLRQRLVRLLMLALYRSGQQAEALHVFRAARHALVEELGVEPGPALQALHQQILNNDAVLDHRHSADTAGRHNLPPDVDDFTGRTDEVHRLLEVIAPEDPGRTALLVNAVNGMPGVGKTALAVHVAHLLADHYPDGQLFLDLHGHQPDQRPRDPADALGALLLLLGVSERSIPATLEQRAAMWRTQLMHRRVVVVLDDATSLAQVEPLLPGSRNCLVLVTSRGRLDGLRTRHTMTLEPMSELDAGSLLGRMLGESRTAGEPQNVKILADLCHRLPLALRIVGARLGNRPSWQIGDLIERLRGPGGLSRLTAGNLSLDATFAESYRRLHSGQRRVITLLGAHAAESFDVGAAAAAAALDSAEAERVLESLVDANLLEARGFGRYAMHALLRDYLQAASTAAGREHADEAVRRVADYHLHTLRNVYRSFFPDGVPVNLGYPLPDVRPLDFGDRSAALRWYQSAAEDLHGIGVTSDGRPRQAGLLRAMSVLCARLGRRDDAVRLQHRAEALTGPTPLPATAAA
ncbi:AfsR/SARP family transcriptional regulator [Micromonospora tulbaghiae]|nr:AfsR/SARP family transcriptional regulator [Micromonospora tulbaghiae]